MRQNFTKNSPAISAILPYFRMWTAKVVSQSRLGKSEILAHYFRTQIHTALNYKSIEKTNVKQSALYLGLLLRQAFNLI